MVEIIDVICMRAGAGIQYIQTVRRSSRLSIGSEAELEEFGRQYLDCDVLFGDEEFIFECRQYDNEYSPTRPVRVMRAVISR